MDPATTENAGARRAFRIQEHHGSGTGFQHRGHSVGRRHLVGDPDAVAGRRVLRADGGVRDAVLPPLVIASEAKQSIFSSRGAMDCFASLAMAMELCPTRKRK